MIYQEKKLKAGYSYKLEEIFGTVTIKSSKRLKGELLDDLIVLMLKNKAKTETITGTIKHNEGEVSYTFKRAPLWSEDDEKPCENTPTSTNKPASVFIAIKSYPVSVLRWFKRFGAAFRAAWKRAR